MPKQSQKGRCAARGEVQPRRWTMQVQLHNCTNTISRAEPHEIKIAHAFMHYALMATHQHKREKSDFPYLYTLTNLCKTCESFITMPNKGKYSNCLEWSLHEYALPFQLLLYQYTYWGQWPNWQKLVITLSVASVEIALILSAIAQISSVRSLIHIVSSAEFSQCITSSFKVIFAGVTPPNCRQV